MCIEEMVVLFDCVECMVCGVVLLYVFVSIVDNMGLLNSGINFMYSNSGMIGLQDGDIFVLFIGDYVLMVCYVKQLCIVLLCVFLGVMFLFLFVDIVSQIFNFGVFVLIDVQVMGFDCVVNCVYVIELLRCICMVFGVVDLCVQQVLIYL